MRVDVMVVSRLYSQSIEHAPGTV